MKRKEGLYEYTFICISTDVPVSNKWWSQTWTMNLFFVDFFFIFGVKPSKVLTHCDLVVPSGITDLGQYWFMQYLVACLAPSHHLNQRWIIFDWTLERKPQWNFNQNTLFFQVNAFDNVVCKMETILFGMSCVQLGLLSLGDGEHNVAEDLQQFYQLSYKISYQTILKLQDIDLHLSDPYEIWQVPRQHSWRGICRIPELHDRIFPTPNLVPFETLDLICQPHWMRHRQCPHLDGHDESLMARYKTAAPPLLSHWRYCILVTAVLN